MADDTSLFLRDLNSLRNAFYRYAGLKFNRSKTEAILLYNSGGIQEDSSLNIKWHSEPFKTLGICYSSDQKEMFSLNIKERMEKNKNHLRDLEY